MSRFIILNFIHSVIGRVGMQDCAFAAAQKAVALAGPSNIVAISAAQKIAVLAVAYKVAACAAVQKGGALAVIEIDVAERSSSLDVPLIF